MNFDFGGEELNCFCRVKDPCGPDPLDPGSDPVDPGKFPLDPGSDPVDPGKGCGGGFGIGIVWEACIDWKRIFSIGCH